MVRKFCFPSKAKLTDYAKYMLKRRGIRVGMCSEISVNKSFFTAYWNDYYKVIASIRLRVNDIIYNSINLKEVNMRFYCPFSRYDIVLFQKVFSDKAYLVALRSKNKGARIILDLNVNYFDTKSKIIKKRQNYEIKRFVQITDAIITTTDYIRDYIVNNGIFSDVFTIPEMISDQFFLVKKSHQKKSELNFLYVGHTIKAKSLELIKNELEQLANYRKIRLITICEKPPDLDIHIKKTFIKFDQSRLPLDIIKGDIFIAPRDISESYNLGHSFVKIGYPMALGLPVIASPVPSYLGSPAVICKSSDEWISKMTELINDSNLRKKLGMEGILYCKSNFSKEVIMKKYEDLFVQFKDK